jgi:hypothetical protein
VLNFDWFINSLDCIGDRNGTTGAEMHFVVLGTDWGCINIRYTFVNLVVPWSAKVKPLWGLANAGSVESKSLKTLTVKGGLNFGTIWYLGTWICVM